MPIVEIKPRGQDRFLQCFVLVFGTTGMDYELRVAEV